MPSREGHQLDSFLLLFDQIGALARRRYQLAERHFATLGLNHSEARLLSLLAAAGGTAGQDNLSNQLNIDRTNAGRALKSLEARGLVDRQQDLADKRSKNVRMTENGQKLAREIAAMKVSMVREFMGNLDEPTARQASALISRMLET
ncbi:MAG: MarR family transcriptional regulator [Alphaproteobacteria bacterium]|nr:MAG: MarR family transcriptional regulator [Alphaproteobacteria bacterium]